MSLVLSGDSPSFSGTYQGGTLTLGTAQNTTSGTAIDFTGIPSWVKRITVMLNGVSTTGTSNLMLQLGSGTIDTSGYVSGASQINSTGSTIVSSTAGLIATGSNSATSSLQGAISISLLSGNTWVGQSSLWNTALVNNVGSGGKTLSNLLDRVRLTTVNGTDAFDAGSVNILYEG